MRSFLVLFAVFLACRASVIPVDISENAEFTRNGNLNRYYLYTRNNRDVPSQVFTNVNSVLNNNILFSRTTVLLIHGHNAGPFSSLNPTVKDALLESEDVNVIVVDWENFSAQAYSQAVGSVPSIGDGVANFIRILVNSGRADLGRIHIVGFDLGAHVAGFAGRNLNGQVARITGLDPSASRWGARSERLTVTDALYVEVIHTDIVGITANGISDAIGDLDFYPNGGFSQPGCVLHACSHDRAWELFASSVKHNHLLANQCFTNLQLSLNTCSGPIQYMGNNQLSKFGLGMFRVNTGRRYPF